jgi:hypothetical protein
MWTKKIMDVNSELKDVSRITVVNDEGRAFEQFALKDIEFSLQDDGRTLKIFVKNDPDFKRDDKSWL